MKGLKRNLSQHVVLLYMKVIDRSRARKSSDP